MLSLKDCLDYSNLSEETVAIISEHEHIPEIIAAEMGDNLLQTERGVREIKRFIMESIERAKRQGHSEKARRLSEIYNEFERSHPAPPKS